MKTKIKSIIVIIIVLFFSIQINAQHLKKDGTPDRRYKENKSSETINAATYTDTKYAIGSLKFKDSDNYDYIGSYSNGLMYVRKNWLYGYVDSIGKIIIPIKYIQALGFNNGYAEVVDNINGVNKTLIIDKLGNIK